MSRIVSSRPSSRNHWKDAFWMSIRLGRSRTCLRREKLVRARGAATLVVKRYSLPYSERENADRRRRKTTARPVKVPESQPPTQEKACGLPRRTIIAPETRIGSAEAVRTAASIPKSPVGGDAWEPGEPGSHCSLVSALAT